MDTDTDPTEDYEFPILTCHVCGNNSTQTTIRYVDDQSHVYLPDRRQVLVKTLSGVYLCVICLKRFVSF